jgi:L-ascorbate metabolism protein UlaG (beta-lactamase superfamily)
MKTIKILLMALFGMVLGISTACAGQTELAWYGHSAFKITTPSGKILLIDPWITNPANKNGKADLAALTHVDLILISHGHADHVGNAVKIANRTGAHLVSTSDLGKVLVAYAGFPKAQAGLDTQGNVGGELSLLNGEVKVAFIPAIHSSGVMDENGKDIHGGSSPGGFLISIKNGPVIYHTGDTDVFNDMSLIPRFHKVDVMLACIGDHFTMGPERAAWATKLVNPSMVIPMHYGTFPVLTGTPAEFKSALTEQGVKAKLVVMSPDEMIKL